MRLTLACYSLRIDFIRKFVSQPFHKRKCINAKLVIQYGNFLKQNIQLFHVSSRYSKCCPYPKQSISNQGRKRKMVSTAQTDEISKTEEGGNIEKSASQLKKEAKRLAKLEKFSKKQEQAHQKAAKEVIYC